MGKTYVIIGAGFRGFCDAMQLLGKKGNIVHIIDRNPFFGGISYSANLKGFAVDNGVHMFDSIPQELADTITEIMEGKVRTIDFVSVSAFNKSLTDGYSLPDLASLDAPTKERIKSELLALAGMSTSHSPKTFAALLESRYGKTAGDIFAKIFKHVYGIDASEVQPDAISKTSFGRLKFLDDPDMLELKQSRPWLDDVLAARRKAIGKVDDMISVYPDSGEAMRGWCERAAAWLVRKGAKLHLGENIKSIENGMDRVTIQTDKTRIEADHIIWTNDNTAALASLLGFTHDAGDYVSDTPMVFATLITHKKHIKDFTYLQNFDLDGITFRTASAGIYSGQTREDGASFITCECPASIESDTWKNAHAMQQKIWEECKALNVVSQDAELLDHHIIRAPVTFKIAKLGYDEKINEFTHELKKRSPRIIFRNVKPFFRRDIYFDSFNIHDLVAA